MKLKLKTIFDAINKITCSRPLRVGYKGFKELSLRAGLLVILNSFQNLGLVPRLFRVLFRVCSAVFLITSVPIVLNAAPSAMVITASSTLTTCFERDINQGTTWFQTETALPAMAATMQHIVVKHCPIRDERILGMLNSAGDIYVSTWTTANSWGNFASNPIEDAITTANDDFRGFDMAYEQSSGDGIVVFQDETASLKYRVWDGAAWGSELDVSITTTSAVPVWVKMASKSNSDEIALIWLSTAAEVGAKIWNGSTWGDEVRLSTWTNTAGSGAYESIAVTYMTSLSSAMFCWGDGTTNMVSRIWNGTSFDAELSPVAIGGNIRWLSLASNTTGLLMALTVDNAGATPDINTILWNGSSWSGATEHDITGNTSANPCADVIWEKASGHENDALLVWGNASASAIPTVYKHFDGASWSADANLGVSYECQVISLDSLSDNTTIWLTAYNNDNTDTIACWWDVVNQVWSSPSTLETVPSKTSTPYCKTFAFSPSIPTAPPPENQAPWGVSGLTQLAGGTTILPSMAWTTSSVIISSFTLKDPNASDTVKFYIHVTSQTSGSNPVWTPLVFAATSQLLTQGTTQYNWPALTDKATYWWKVWCEDNSGLSSPNTSYYLADDVAKVAKFGFTPPPNAPGTLQQINNLGTVLNSMQWTNSSTVISSFTQSSSASGDLKFHLQVSSFTGFSPLLFETTSQLIAQGTTGYQWPALTDNGTYWWRVWSEDSNGYTSSTSSVLDVGGDAKLGFDNTAPDAVTNLTALAGWRVDSVVLRWTAPTGSPSSYLMRYSTASFSDGEWAASWVKNLNTKATIPTPSAPGITEIMLITGLTNGTSYWFAIKSQDTLGQISAINSNTQDFAVAQTSYPIVINEIAPWQSGVGDPVEFYVKNDLYAGGLKFYRKEETTPYNLTLAKTFPTTGGVWEQEIPKGTYIVLYLETSGTDETTVGQSLANALKIYNLSADGMVGTDGYCVLSSTAGLTIASNIMTAGTILDFVVYSNQVQSGFGAAYDKDNIDYAISKGHWVSTCTVTCSFDCPTSQGADFDDVVARNATADKIYNSKYDWAFGDEKISTGTVNGTIDSSSGGGTCTVTPDTAQISTAGTWKFKYSGNFAADTARHTLVVDIPYGWTQPQHSDATLAGYTTAFFNSDPPAGDADFSAGYGVTISQIIGTNAGWRIIVNGMGVTAAADNLYVVYGATYASTNGVATAPATGGAYTFRVYSDTNGVNVSEIASSPQITVTESVPPAAISDLTALEGTDDGIVKLNWTSPGDNGVTGDLTGTFRIKYSSVSIISSGNFDAPASSLAVVTVNISTTSLTPLTACTTTMYGLNPGTSYWFAIKTADAVNNWSVWNSSANVLTVNTSAYAPANDQIPPAPTNLVAQQGNQQITLTWTAVTGEPDLDFYRIYCDSNPPVGEEWYVVGTTPSVYTTYLHTGLTNNSTYNYRITVVDLGNSTSGYSTANESTYSNTYSTYPYTVPPKASLVYFSTGTTSPDNITSVTPSFRKWDGTNFGSEETTVNMGGCVDLFTVVRMCPQSIREETIVGVLDRSDAASSPDIKVSTYTAANGWGTVVTLSPKCGTSAPGTRRFDVAYEQLSGEALVVVRREDAGYPDSTKPYYYTYNGTSLSAIQTDLTHGIGGLSWVRLEPKPNSDEIILVTCDSNNDVYASVWNGSAWGNTQLLETESVSAAQGFDVAYTQSAGVGFVVWVDVNSTRPQYRTWDGYSWSAETTTVHDHYALAAGRNIKLAANPKNNELLLGTNDSGDDINVEVWSSSRSVWLGGKEIDPTARALTIRTFDVAYEKSSGEGLLVYGDAAGGIPVVWTWNAGGSGAWAAGTNANDTGAATLNWVQLASDDQSDKIHLITSDADNDINVQTWSGSSWGSITEVETESSNSYESFFCRFPRTAAPADIIAPAAVTSLSGLAVATSTGTIKLTWSAPGDDVWLGRLKGGDGPQYRIDYTTSTENRIWYYWTAVSSPTGSDTFAPGLFLSTTIQNLVGDCSYYCKIKYYDGTNWGELSNEATAYASAPILSVDIVTEPATYNFGEVALGASTQTITTIQVKNDGNIVENFALRCGTNTAGSPWYSIETSSGADNYLLRAVFHPSQPAFGGFELTDVVSDDDYQVSQTGVRYTVDGSETGVNVGVNSTKNLWLRLDMPLTSQTVAPQEIILYIRAESP